MKAHDTYKKLQELGTRTQLTEAIGHLLEWDQETHMPAGGISLRAQQKQLIAEFKHREETNPEFEKHLSELINLDNGEVIADGLDDAQKAALREWLRDLLRSKKLPDTFVAECAKVTSEATHAWAEARSKNDFSIFAPHLKKVVTLCQKKSNLLGPADHPYDNLIDEFEPGMTVAVLDPLFAALKPKLIALKEQLKERNVPDRSFLHANFDKDKIFSLCQELLKTMRNDGNHSKLDKSNHPYCIGTPHDLRMTTHTDTSNLFANVSATMHEGGHGLYALGLDPENFGTPLGQATSLALHESQSRFYECYIGQSLPFCRYFTPVLKKTFPDQFSSTDPDKLFHAINVVEPSLIRIYADEVTYILHVILRYEIEKDLLTQEIGADDIPALWNAKMEEMLGIVPPSDDQGCLQDIHWSLGCIGYFPTYALGTLLAAHWHELARKALPDLDTQIEQGNFKPIREYLRENIHIHGRRYLTQELLQKLSGEELSPEPFLRYLDHKYNAQLCPK